MPHYHFTKEKLASQTGEVICFGPPELTLSGSWSSARFAMTHSSPHTLTNGDGETHEAALPQRAHSKAKGDMV